VTSEQLKDQIITHIQEKKGEKIVVLNLQNVTNIADYFILCTGTVEPHIKAIRDNVVDKLSERDLKCWHIEGQQAMSWVLLDYVDVVVHIFSPYARDYYKLEKLWADAQRIEISDGEDTSSK
jgi:ribosome-associated protein